jgi:NADH dehydrogenase/NADH:ubiquinone oxidoreductase subunit G
MEDSLLEPYEKEIRIRIGGKEFVVPENNTLLRILQHLASEISYSRFCWNGDCHNCLVTYRTGNFERKGLACRLKVTDGMEIPRLPEGIDLD